MRTLVFEPTLTGHHLEYLHHLYVGASKKSSCSYIFAVPEKQWLDVKNKFQWNSVKNIAWLMLDDEECKDAQSGSLIRQSWHIPKLIKKTIVRSGADSIILVTLSNSIPVLPFIVSRNIQISGIIYKIYLRAKQSILRKFIDRIRYSVMARSHKIKDVFILNDSRSAVELNRIYSTNKFVPLPDPVPEVNVCELRDLRQELGINPEEKIFLHFGAMDSRKGTIEILNALCIMPTDTISDKVFVFAGRVGESIRQSFYCKVDAARKHGANIIVKDEFCSYEYLNNLYYTADCILIPYLLTDLSSGAIGYAAVHRKAVIGPASGLVGDLIRDNHLGMTLDKITAETLADAIINFKPVEVNTDYAVHNTVDAFNSTILY